jgi:predicted membrane protein
MMPYRISFGLAGSYYASGFAFMGILGVMILAVIFLGGLYVMNRCAATQKGLVRITLVILGSTFAVYAHRNGLDNLLSFARQIFIMGVFLNSVASIVRLLKFKGKRYPA